MENNIHFLDNKYRFYNSLFKNNIVTSNYYNSNKKFETIEVIDVKNNITSSKFYNRNGVLSSIVKFKHHSICGLYLFYCNKYSNLNEIHNNKFW